MQANIYIAVSSVHPKQTDKTYGYVLEYVKDGTPYTREGFGQTHATCHGACLQAILAALGRFCRDCEITIYAEDIYVLNMIEKGLPVWAENGFLTSKGKPVKDTELWSQLWPLCQKYKIKGVPGRHQYSSWLWGEFRRNQENVV